MNIHDGDLKLVKAGDRVYWYAYNIDKVLLVRVAEGHWVYIGVFKTKGL